MAFHRKPDILDILCLGWGAGNGGHPFPTGTERRRAHRMQGTWMQMVLPSWVRWNFGRVCWRALKIWTCGPPSCWPMVESFFPPLPLVAIVALERCCPWRTAGLCVQLGRSCFGRYGHVFVLAAHRQALLLACRPAGTSCKAALGQPVRHRLPVYAVAAAVYPPPPLYASGLGISDFDEKRYLITVMLGKGIMVGMMALFGQSLVSALKNPFYLILAVPAWAPAYCVSKYFCKTQPGIRTFFSPVPGPPGAGFFYRKAPALHKRELCFYKADVLLGLTAQVKVVNTAVGVEDLAIDKVRGIGGQEHGRAYHNPLLPHPQRPAGSLPG